MFPHIVDSVALEAEPDEIVADMLKARRDKRDGQWPWYDPLQDAACGPPPTPFRQDRDMELRTARVDRADGLTIPDQQFHRPLIHELGVFLEARHFQPVCGLVTDLQRLSGASRRPRLGAWRAPGTLSAIPARAR